MPGGRSGRRRHFPCRPGRMLICCQAMSAFARRRHVTGQRAVACPGDRPTVADRHRLSLAGFSTQQTRTGGLAGASTSARVTTLCANEAVDSRPERACTPADRRTTGQPWLGHRLTLLRGMPARQCDSSHARSARNNSKVVHLQHRPESAVPAPRECLTRVNPVRAPGNEWSNCHTGVGGIRSRSRRTALT